MRFNPTLPATLEELARDLETYARGELPVPAALAVAPLLSDWRVAYRPAVALHGTTVDHPILSGVRNVATSELYFLDPDLRWARTFSRLYRLGPARYSGLN